MGNSTSIEWAANADGSPGATWNPIRARDRETGLTGTFCVHASDGCKHCYAETMQGRKLPGNGIGLAYTAPNLARVEHYLDEKMLAAPLKRRKPTTYFLSSMTDIFGEWVPDAMLDRLFAVMALCPRHTFIVVTKRARRMRAYISDTQSLRACKLVGQIFREAKLPSTMRGDAVMAEYHLGRRAGEPLPNVWLIVSAEDQRNANERIPHLLATPAAVRGVSCEPLLGATDLRPWLPGCLECARSCGWRGIDTTEEQCNACGWYGRCEGEFCPSCGKQDFSPSCPLCNTYCVQHHPDTPNLDWIICGGESGRDARPMHPDWARSLRDQCAAAGVPFFFKQWGEHSNGYDRDRDDPDWRHCSEISDTDPRGQWLNLAGGQGFHGERVVRVTPVGKARAGRLLDGVEHNARPPIGAQR